VYSGFSCCGDGVTAATELTFLGHCQVALETMQINIKFIFKSFNSEMLCLNVLYIKYTFCKLGQAVTQLVEALHYTPEGRGFDFRWVHCDSLLT
jgi:hypothetical protein